MEFLKDVFGTEALTFEQLSEKLKDSKDVKLANLASGDYVGAEKFKALEETKTGLALQLEEASKTIDGFKSMDIDAIKAAADTYKKDSEAATQKALQAEENAARRIAAIEAASGQVFSSNSAKNAFIAALMEKGLPVENGAFTGFSDFLTSYKETDPDAFKSDVPPVRITSPTTPPAPSESWREKVQANYQTLLKGE